MPSPRSQISAFAFAVLLGAPSLAAHDGDPKLRDRLPRIEASRGGAGGSSNLTIDSETFAFPASNVQLLAWLPLRDFGAQMENGNSCSGYVSPAGREYAVMGLSHGTGFVDVTDPGVPRIVAVIAGPHSLWRDMKVFQDKVYAVSEGGHGIQVIDVSQIDAGSVTLLGEITSGGPLATHTVALNADSGFLYRCGGSQRGLRIYDLAIPASPSFVAEWGTRYVHEAQVVSYTSGPWAGKEIVFAFSGFNGGFTQPGIDILDVTNKQSIQLIRRFFYSNAQYSHQGWLSEDKHYLYVNDELDENGANLMRTRLIDVSDLANPVELPSFTTGSVAIDHNLYVRGNRLFEANYRSGLHVFDLSNPTAPVEIASFDTWPQDEGAAFNSLWNNYPFFPSETVLGSDIEKGLFVWKIGASELDFVLNAPRTLAPSGALLPLQVIESAPGVLLPGSVTLHYDVGAGWSTIALTAGAPGMYTLAFPALACGQDVAWYVSARTSGGTTWSYPQGAPVLVRHATVASALDVTSFERLEQPAGWTIGASTDTASAGVWQNDDPAGSVAEPQDDHSAQGTRCWFTEQGNPLLTPATHDVDGGATTLVSPLYDLSAPGEHVISYWRWFHSSESPQMGGDELRVEIANDGGANWSLVESIVSGAPAASGGWVLHQFRVADVIQASATVRLRFIAADWNQPSLVEAAIDDLAFATIECTPPPLAYCTAKVNSLGCTPAVGFVGTPSASSSAAFEVNASNVLSQKSGLMFYGHGRADVPFQGGTMCAAPPLRRTPIQNSLGNPPPVDCSGTFSFDFNALIRAGVDPTLVPGATLNAQYWYRDALDPTGFGSGLTDALEFTIQP